MSNPTLTNVLVIYGSTASGKSNFAMQLAKNCNAVIINADSSQVYHEIRVLNNSPTPSDTLQTPHQLFNYVSLNTSYSVGKWLFDATEAINTTIKDQKIAIIVGGTGMYINALLYGLSDLPSDAVKKQESIDLYNKIGHTEFTKLVTLIDTDFVKKFTDKQRLTRAYEIYLITGQPITLLQTLNPPKANDSFNFVNIFIKKDKQLLLTDIRERFLNMVKNGVLDEIKTLNNEAYCKKFIGALELSNYLNNIYPLQDCVEKAILKTNQYAKRQNTWFKNKIVHNLIIDNKSANELTSISILKKYFNNLNK